jgi:hypothetical protein
LQSRFGARLTSKGVAASRRGQVDGLVYMQRAVLRIGLLLGVIAVVCAAQSLPLADPGAQAARVVSLSGQVSVMHDAQPWALAAGDQVMLGQAVVSGPDGFAVFQVSDGSTFEVYPNSHVVFRKTPGNLKDLLDVLIGRVKVHIQKWGGQPNFNRVFTPTAVISVRGTTFFVEVDESDDTTLVLVDEGLVEVQHAQHPGTPKLLGAGEWLRVYRNVPLASVRVERSTVLRSAFRALAQALQTAVSRGPRIPGLGSGSTLPGGGSTSPGGGVTLPGDTGTVPVPPTLPGDTGGTTTPPPPPEG